MVHVSSYVSSIFTILKLPHLTYNSLSKVYGCNEYGAKSITNVWITYVLSPNPFKILQHKGPNTTIYTNMDDHFTQMCLLDYIH